MDLQNLERAIRFLVYAHGHRLGTSDIAMTMLVSANTIHLTNTYVKLALHVKKIPKNHRAHCHIYFPMTLLP
ncbi:hypothetical protein [Candidatus Uabimicrobium amorphum]|uniref:Uncharacterized protein n=1 Tax=Uabimicrobium amorphum TaxID=2596890 RepID=A0A5S9IJ99_UABAM|nr:hypothetical protein [Candidatus Uabimicrobium amorphum]BBM82873.1 hypothetical protein UABAM_01216 [Candidatus Uabimicrobium amorphum]